MMFTGAGVVLLAFGTTYGVSTMLSEPTSTAPPNSANPPRSVGRCIVAERSIIAAAPSKPFEATPLPSAGTLPGNRTNHLPTAGVLSMIAPPGHRKCRQPKRRARRHCHPLVPPVQGQRAGTDAQSRVAAASDVTGSVPPSASVPNAASQPTGVVPAVPYVMPGNATPASSAINAPPRSARTRRAADFDR